MYFPAESDEELELERDLDQLMKELRVQEDLFWRVIECISKITRADEGENYIFIHEDIRKYRCVIEEARQEAQGFKQMSFQMIQKYEQNQMKRGNGENLLKRAVFRLLEMLFNNISLINHKFPQMYQEYLKVKLHCQRILQFNTPNRPYQLINIITSYSISKLKKYVELLLFLVAHLENGDTALINPIEINLFLQKHHSTEMVNKKPSPQAKQTPFEFSQVSKTKAQQMEAKSDGNHSKVISRKMKRLYENLKKVVEINKSQYIQSLFAFSEATKEDLFKELLLRNQKNEKEINQFSNKKRKFQAKINKEDLIMDQKEKENVQIQEPINIKNHLKPLNNTKNIKNGRFPVDCQTVHKPSKMNEFRSSIEYIEENEEQTEQAIEDQKKFVAVSANGPAIKSISNQNIDKLPVLKRRAFSVDKNYNKINTFGSTQAKNNIESAVQAELRVLSSSIKLNHLSQLKQINQSPFELKLDFTPTIATTLPSSHYNKSMQKAFQIKKRLCF